MEHCCDIPHLCHSCTPVLRGDIITNARRSYETMYTCRVEGMCRCYISETQLTRPFQCSRSVCAVHLSNATRAAFPCCSSVAAGYLLNIRFLGGSRFGFINVKKNGGVRSKANVLQECRSTHYWFHPS